MGTGWILATLKSMIYISGSKNGKIFLGGARCQIMSGWNLKNIF
jgi:hypothetical protein